MDPVTHAVVARMAASVGRAPLPRAAAVLSLTAGLAPDLDAVFMPAGWDIYLRVHESGTHSLAGGALLAAALAGASRSISALAFRSAFAIALTSVVTHILLDIVSGATVRPGWPLISGRTALGLVAMGDLWLAVPAALALLIASTTRWSLDRLAPAMLLLLVAILGIKVFSRQLARTEYQKIAEHAAAAPELQAQWSSLSRWWVYEKVRGRIRLWDVDGWQQSTTLVLDRELADPRRMIAGEGELSTVRNFLLAHHLPVRLTRRTETTTVVWWSDLRFCFAPGGKNLPAGSPMRPLDDSIACGIWFGGEIDADGRPRRQFVTIGNLVQDR